MTANKIHLSSQAHDALSMLNKGYIMESRGEIEIKVRSVWKV